MIAHPPSWNDAVFATLEPFLLAAAWHRDHFDRRPFGLPIPDENVIDPLHVESSIFLERLTMLDQLTFGLDRMPMPGWVFYDGAAVPGGVFGFAARAEALPPPVAARLGLTERDTGLVPLSQWIALPMHPPHTWFGHNLASLNRLCPELGLRGLGSITKAMALKAFRCERQLGATQWDSPALHIHTRFGPLALITAWTPAHSLSETLTYRIDVTDLKLRAALGDPDAFLAPRQAELELDVRDTDTMKALQARLESGERFAIVGPPRRREDGSITVPIGRGEFGASRLRAS